jgi:catechol 2,3-dioxygenase-like lactoylglutathione lyase family enzyme
MAIAALAAAAAIVGVSAQVPAARPRITGIDHVVLRVADADAARQFYGGLLGLRASSEPRGRRADAPRLRFEVGRRQAILVDADLPPGEDERLRLLAFATPDLAALAALLEAKGVEVTRTDGPPAAILAIDPDGHPLAFVDRPWPPEDISRRPVVFRGAAPVSARLLHAGLGGATRRPTGSTCACPTARTTWNTCW